MNLNLDEHFKQSQGQEASSSCDTEHRKRHKSLDDENTSRTRQALDIEPKKSRIEFLNLESLRYRPSRSYYTKRHLHRTAGPKPLVSKTMEDALAKNPSLAKTRRSLLKRFEATIEKPMESVVAQYDPIAGLSKTLARLEIFQSMDIDKEE
ncbi:GL26034 [Drosophila persimilis]|uniref:GL26034 n=1 Tax=Drosophila persimilis TaxID=7234 RepID=B4GK91_DROPE|nr:uncharacterized protein LOC6593407 [Drosophila persimilis]EDW37057.1 GL26034 [Drosophila persimilis]